MHFHNARPDSGIGVQCTRMLVQKSMPAKGIIGAQNPGGPLGFSHVVNPALRRVLRADLQQITDADLRNAVSLTLEALGCDIVNGDVQARALDQRIAAARRAERLQTRPASCRRALRQVWSI